MKVWPAAPDFGLTVTEHCLSVAVTGDAPRHTSRSVPKDAASAPIDPQRTISQHPYGDQTLTRTVGARSPVSGLPIRLSNRRSLTPDPRIGTTFGRAWNSIPL